MNILLDVHYTHRKNTLRKPIRTIFMMRESSAVCHQTLGRRKQRGLSDKWFLEQCVIGILTYFHPRTIPKLYRHNSSLKTNIKTRSIEQWFLTSYVLRPLWRFSKVSRSPFYWKKLSHFFLYILQAIYTIVV